MSDSIIGNHSSTPTPTEQLIGYAIQLGAVTFFKLAMIYSIAMSVVLIAIDKTRADQLPALFLWSLVLTFVFGVVPAMEIGALDGFLMATILAFLHRKVPNWFMACVSVVIGISMTMLFHIVFWLLTGVRPYIDPERSNDLLDLVRAYLSDGMQQWLVIPSIVIILASAWMGRILINKRTAQPLNEANQPPRWRSE